MVGLPLRPKDDEQHKIPKLDKEILTVEVLTGWPNERVYAMFHPELATESFRQLNAAGKRECRQFHTYNKNKAYKESYEQTVQEFLNCKKSATKSDTISIDDSRKDRALKSLLNQAMSLVEGGSDLDAETIKMCSDIFTKLGLIKSEEEREIRPIRVLPSLCRECRYKAFVESSVLNNEAIDCCAWCKARKIAEENGYRFNDGKNLLEIPQEIIDELESKNNVSILDIINGKIEN